MQAPSCLLVSILCFRVFLACVFLSPMSLSLSLVVKLATNPVVKMPACLCRLCLSVSVSEKESLNRAYMLISKTLNPEP